MVSKKLVIDSHQSLVSVASIEKTRKAATPPPKPAQRKAKACEPLTQDDLDKFKSEVVALTTAPKKERKPRVLSDEQRQVLRERLVKARQVRADKKAAIIN